MVLVKLEGNKKRLIDFLMNGEKPFFEVADYFKGSLKEKKDKISKLKKPLKKEYDGISKPAVSIMVHSLNPGLISFRTNKHGEKMVILNKEKLITKYASDRFLPHIILMAVAWLITGIIALFISMWYFWGSTSILIPIFIYLCFLVSRTSKMKDYFYEKSGFNAKLELTTEGDADTPYITAESG